MGGALAAFHANRRLVYLGGFGEDLKASKSVYEYEGINEGWRLWRREAPTPIANATFTGVGVDFCLNSNDVKRLKRLDPDGEKGPKPKRWMPNSLMYVQ